MCEMNILQVLEAKHGNTQFSPLVIYCNGIFLSCIKHEPQILTPSHTSPLSRSHTHGNGNTHTVWSLGIRCKSTNQLVWARRCVRWQSLLNGGATMCDGGLGNLPESSETVMELVPRQRDGGGPHVRQRDGAGAHARRRDYRRQGFQK